VIGTANLTWKGDSLLLGRRLLATLEPEPDYPGQWFVRLATGPRTADFYNRARAKQHAYTLVLGELNAPLASVAA
jgi:hypothetical protein